MYGVGNRVRVYTCGHVCLFTFVSLAIPGSNDGSASGAEQILRWESCSVVRKDARQEYSLVRSSFPSTGQLAAS